MAHAGVYERPVDLTVCLGLGEWKHKRKKTRGCQNPIVQYAAGVGWLGLRLGKVMDLMVLMAGVVDRSVLVEPCEVQVLTGPRRMDGKAYEPIQEVSGLRHCADSFALVRLQHGLREWRADGGLPQERTGVC